MIFSCGWSCIFYHSRASQSAEYLLYVYVYSRSRLVRDYTRVVDRRGRGGGRVRLLRLYVLR